MAARWPWPWPWTWTWLGAVPAPGPAAAPAMERAKAAGAALGVVASPLCRRRRTPAASSVSVSAAPCSCSGMAGAPLTAAARACASALALVAATPLVSSNAPVPLMPALDARASPSTEPLTSAALTLADVVADALPRGKRGGRPCFDWVRLRAPLAPDDPVPSPDSAKAAGLPPACASLACVAAPSEHIVGGAESGSACRLALLVGALAGVPPGAVMCRLSLLRLPKDVGVPAALLPLPASLPPAAAPPRSVDAMLRRRVMPAAAGWRMSSREKKRCMPVPAPPAPGPAPDAAALAPPVPRTVKAPPAIGGACADMCKAS